MKKSNDFFRGCLLGGAIGDALGAPVEFMSLDRIMRKFGPEGIQDLQVDPTGKAQITDDIQMTLFAAEGILRAQSRNIEKNTHFIISSKVTRCTLPSSFDLSMQPFVKPVLAIGNWNLSVSYRLFRFLSSFSRPINMSRPPLDNA